MLSYFYLTLAQTMVGISIVGSKYLIHKLDLFQLLTLRFSLGTLLIYLVAKIMHPSVKINYKDLSKIDWYYLTMQALTAGFFFNILLLSGLKLTSASVAGILTSALPAIIFIFSFIFLKETLNKAKLKCIGLALLGLFCINYKNIIGHTLKGETFLGDVIVMLALIPEASFYILVKIHRCNLPSAVSGVWIMAINALCFAPFTLVHTSPHKMIELTYFDWLVMGALALSTALFYVFWSIGSRDLEASITSLFTAVMPISTLIIAWLSLGESLNIYQVGGMGLIILSIFVSTRTMRQYTQVRTPAPP